MLEVALYRQISSGVYERHNGASYSSLYSVLHFVDCGHDEISIYGSRQLLQGSRNVQSALINIITYTPFQCAREMTLYCSVY